MKRYARAITLVLFFAALVSFLFFQLSHDSSKLEHIKSNRIHFPYPPAKDPSLLDKIEDLFISKPKYNPWNEHDQLIVDRNIQTFYIFAINRDVSRVFEQESNLMVVRGIKEITINLHSPGGYLAGAYFIVQQIEILKEKGIRIHTVIDSQNACMSACPIIFLAGDTRIAYADSVFMFHSPYINFPYNTPEDVIVQMLKDLRRDKDDYAIMLANYCPTYPDIQMDIYDHKNHYYTVADLNFKCSKTFFTSEPIDINRIKNSK